MTTATRPFYWSIRREIWENRSLYIAPLIVAVVVLFGTLMSNVTLAKRMRNADPVKQQTTLVKPLRVAPAPIMLATWLVGLFYAIDALYGERRDRSILFWKSLPISDTTTVFAKAAIPLVVLPAIAIALSYAVVLILLLAMTGAAAAGGASPARIWAEYRFVQEPIVMVYGMVVHALWFAPVYCFLLLVSAWARRAPLLWAVLPPFILGSAERIILGSSGMGAFLKYRFLGAMQTAFVMKGQGHDPGVFDKLAQLTPLRFLTTPGLWLGLIAAAGFVFGAIRLRRAREPI